MALETQERKRRLDDARAALASKEANAMRQALAMLPTDGQKAIRLRQQLTNGLSSGAAGSPQDARVERTPLRSADARVIEGGVTYSVCLADLGPSADLIGVCPKGGTVEIYVNRDHAACPLLAGPAKDTLTEAARAMVVAWALLEFEAGNDRRRERFVDMRSDWSRALSRLARNARRT